MDVLEALDARNGALEPPGSSWSVEMDVLDALDARNGVLELPRAFWSVEMEVLEALEDVEVPVVEVVPVELMRVSFENEEKLPCWRILLHKQGPKLELGRYLSLGAQAYQMEGLALRP